MYRAPTWRFGGVKQPYKDGGSLDGETGGREAGVEGDGLRLKIENEGVVQVFLDVEGDLGSRRRGRAKARPYTRPYTAVVGVANFGGDIETGVVIRVNVEGDSRRKESGGIEINLDLREVLEKGGGIGGAGKRLRKGNVLDCLSVMGLVAHVGGDVAGSRELLRDDKGAKEPCWGCE